VGPASSDLREPCARGVHTSAAAAAAAAASLSFLECGARLPARGQEGVTVLGSAWPPSVWWWCGGIRRLTERFGGAHPLFGLFRFQPVY
jgi:hypothetical protein